MGEVDTHYSFPISSFSPLAISSTASSSSKSISSSHLQCVATPGTGVGVLATQVGEEDEPPENRQENPNDQEIVTEPTFNYEYEGPKFNCPAFSYMNPKILCKKGPNGCGLFANRPLSKNELLLGWAGKVVHLSEILQMDESERTYILQIDEELFQVPFWKGYNEPADFVNHSCNPNAGFRFSPICLVAMRDIDVGEEISFDYAMCECVDGLKGNEFECQCGHADCRGAFTGADWKNPKLWDKYGDYFSPYLREKIKQYRMKLTETENETSNGSPTNSRSD